MLDVGCNVGELLIECSKRYDLAKLCGVDVNLDAIFQARRNLPEAQIYHIADSNLPFRDASFDCVTCIEVIEHVPAHLRESLLKSLE